MKLYENYMKNNEKQWKLNENSIKMILNCMKLYEIVWKKTMELYGNYMKKYKII